MRTGNIHEGKKGFAVTAQKYEPIRDAILAVLPSTKEGMSYDELVSAVEERVPKELFPKRGSVKWYTTVVQLDLEKRGLIERIPGRTPLRLRRVQ